MAFSSAELASRQAPSARVMATTAASLVAAVLNGLADRSAVVQLTGGELHVHWDARDNHVYQTGPATFVFDGVWLGA